jgi:hypothetical protein
LAWLNAAPKPDRDERVKGKPPEPVSRLKQMLAANAPPAMPDTSAAWMIDWLMEIGPAEAAGMGLAPISWASIDKWADRTGTPLTSWQALTLRRLSSEYISFGHHAEKMACPPPWEGVLPSLRAVNERAIDSMFGD